MAGIFGAGYLLTGLLGFTATSGTAFFSVTGGFLVGVFELNGFHHVIHLLIGAALVMASLSGAAASKTVNTAAGAFCLLLGIVGFFLVGTDFNLLAINAADNAAHCASAALLLAVGLGAETSSPNPERAGG